MRYSLSVILLITVLSYSSCKKADDTHATRLVKAMKIDSNACLISCIYDDQNRIVSATQCDTIETFIYSNDSVIYARWNAGLITYKYIYKLNIAGIAVSYTRVAADGSLSYFTLSYDAAWHKTEWRDHTHDSTYRTYTIVDGNVVNEFSKSTVASQGNYTINTIYYANTENTLGNDNFGRHFLGESSTNLRKAEAYDTPDGQFTINYNYELDFQNGIHKRITTINGTVSETRYYEYY